MTEMSPEEYKYQVALKYIAEQERKHADQMITAEVAFTQRLQGLERSNDAMAGTLAELQQSDVKEEEGGES